MEEREEEKGEEEKGKKAQYRKQQILIIATLFMTSDKKNKQNQKSKLKPLSEVVRRHNAMVEKSIGKQSFVFNFLSYIWKELERIVFGETNQTLTGVLEEVDKNHSGRGIHSRHFSFKRPKV